MDNFGKVFFLAMFLFLVFVGFAGYRDHKCSLYCNDRNQICADNTIGSDHYVCMDPNARNVRIVEDQ